MHPLRGFTGPRAGTVGTSLTRSCAPELSGVGSRVYSIAPIKYPISSIIPTAGHPPYPARHLATLRESGLLPAFSGASPG